MKNADKKMPKGMAMPFGAKPAAKSSKGAKSAKAMPFPPKAGTTMGRMKMQGKKAK